MTGLPAGSEAALAPVRESLLAAAGGIAADIRADAHEQVQALLDAATSEADSIRADAIANGEAAARSEAALRSARARREASEVVLARRNALRLELQRQVHESALALRTDPRYPVLLARLKEHGRALLGADATITEGPDGGVIAEAGSRRLNLSLPTLASETLESMMAEVSPLWST
jgi:vacuolar-type H+-ATPase subunit E/Vma4